VPETDTPTTPEVTPTPSNESAPQSAAAGPKAAAEPTPEVLIETLKAQLTEKDKKYAYLYADFENFKKRIQKEKSESIKFSVEPVAHELLPIVDNMERALEHAPPGTDKNLVEGIHMILKQFKTALEKHGVHEVETHQKSFDPNFHEAVSKEDSENHPEGTILKTHFKGYTLHGRLLRPAKVVVSGGGKSEE
jgi:molecular chaperone GrpE